MQIVSHLLTLVSIDAIVTPLETGTNKISQETMKFRPGMGGARETAPAEYTGRHIEIPTIFLN